MLFDALGWSRSKQSDSESEQFDAPSCGSSAMSADGQSTFDPAPSKLGGLEARHLEIGGERRSRGGRVCQRAPDARSEQRQGRQPAGSRADLPEETPEAAGLGLLEIGRLPSSWPLEFILAYCWPLGFLLFAGSSSGQYDGHPGRYVPKLFKSGPR